MHRLTDVDIPVATQYVFGNETAATEMTLASALGDVVTCAANHQGEAEVRCAEDDGDFELSGCSRNVCVSGSGNRSGYTVSVDEAVTVDGLGAVACGPDYAGEADVSCAADDSNFTFSGCNRTCLPGRAIARDTLSRAKRMRRRCTILGGIVCAENWHSDAGLASASCVVPGGEFVFSGCSENRCDAVSEALLLDGAAGYVAEINATKVSDLSPSCAAGYHGSASVSCVEDSGSFAFSGCAPNECILRLAARRRVTM